MMMAASAGDSVSAMIPETTIEIATVMANCLYSVPVTPPRNATGRNTASSTSTIEISAPAISVIACFAASSGDKPCLRDVRLDVLDHHDGVVHHQPDRQESCRTSSAC